MAYEYERIIKKELEYTDLSNAEDQAEMLNELQEVYKKAKAFDEIKKFTTERLKEQELTDEYDFGERFMCEEIERILEDKQNEL